MHQNGEHWHARFNEQFICGSNRCAVAAAVGSDKRSGRQNRPVPLNGAPLRETHDMFRRRGEGQRVLWSAAYLGPQQMI